MAVTEDFMINVTEDLMMKIGADVSDAMMRTLSLSLADEQLPIAISGGSAAVGVIAAVLNPNGDAPDPDCIMLAALLIARTGSNHPDPVSQAYKDLEVLQALEFTPTIAS